MEFEILDGHRARLDPSEYLRGQRRLNENVVVFQATQLEEENCYMSACNNTLTFSNTVDYSPSVHAYKHTPSSSSPSSSSPVIEHDSFTLHTLVLLGRTPAPRDAL